MKAAIIGYGKMGREIEKILLERGHSVALVIDTDNASDLNAANLAQADVALEFTMPTTAYGNIRTCIENATPVVSGTTGWTERLHEAEALCRQHGGAFFYASNYSIGVNVFFEVNRKLAELMNCFGTYDVTVEETHHTQKKDAPSGTALMLADAVKSQRPDAEYVYGRSGQHKRQPNEIGIHSLRMGNVVGEHEVIFATDNQTITLKHQAHDRALFAEGALTAAGFLVGQPAGFYHMDDLLGP